MSEAKYTKGKWSVGIGIDGSVNIMCNTMHIAECWINEDTKANAAVLAASTDLYEALTALLDRYVGLVNCGDCGSWDAEQEPEVIAAHAALKKATP